jgi:hypothetical protein
MALDKKLVKKAKRILDAALLLLYIDLVLLLVFLAMILGRALTLFGCQK